MNRVDSLLYTHNMVLIKHIVMQVILKPVYGFLCASHSLLYGLRGYTGRYRVHRLPNMRKFAVFIITVVFRLRHGHHTALISHISYKHKLLTYMKEITQKRTIKPGKFNCPREILCVQCYYGQSMYFSDLRTAVHNSPHGLPASRLQI